MNYFVLENNLQEHDSVFKNFIVKIGKSDEIFGQ